MVDIAANTSTSATLAVGGTASNSLEFAGDHDWFRIQLTAGDEISVALDGMTLSDPMLRIRDLNGNILYQNDDGGAGLDSLLAFRASYTGSYYIDVGSAPENQTGSYQLSVTPYSPPPLGTLDQMADWLTDGFWDGDRHHFDVAPGGTITVNLTGLTADSATVARAALQLWTDIIGVTFSEVTSGGQIVFDDLEQGTGAFSDGVWANGITTSATVNVSPSRLGSGSGIVRVGLQTYIHEIGHALGLGHNGDYNGGTAFSRYPYEALFLNDGAAVSIMSYFDNGENSYYANQGFTNNLVVTPQLADIIAVGNLYGLSTTTRAGDTTYGFNNNSGREVFDAALHPNVAYTIFDSGGVDTLDYSGFGTSQLIDLHAEAFSNVGTSRGNVVIARGTLIENAKGGSGADEIRGNDAGNALYGNAGIDKLIGNAGNDRLDGGTGIDRLIGGTGNDTYFADDYGDAIVENLGEGTDAVFANSNFRLRANVENLTLTGSSNIWGYGNDLDNVLTGNSNINKLFGLGGNDTLDGAAGDDRMTGGIGDDRYFADSYSDQAIENAGEGTDSVFAGTNYKLGLNIEKLTLTGSAAVWGYGNGDDNILTGNTGANKLYGLGGADTLTGGTGADWLEGGAGQDRLFGGAGNDNIVFREGDFAGLTISTCDAVKDFATGDKVRLNFVDANTLLASDQAFAFVGTAAFSHTAGELRYEQISGNTYLSGDTNGDGVADFLIRLDGLHTLGAGDLVL